MTDATARRVSSCAASRVTAYPMSMCAEFGAAASPSASSASSDSSTRAASSSPVISSADTKEQASSSSLSSILAIAGSASASRSSVARSCARRSGRVAAEASRSSRFAPAPLGASRGGSSPPRCWDRTAFSSSARRWSTIVLWCCRPLKTRWSSAPSRGAGDAAASSCVTRKRPRVTARAAAGGIAPPRPGIFCGA